MNKPKSQAFAGYQEGTPFWYLHRVLQIKTIYGLCKVLTTETGSKIQPQIIYAWKKKQNQVVPSRYAIQIAKLFDGEVTAHQLNPLIEPVTKDS